MHTLGYRFIGIRFPHNSNLHSVVKAFNTQQLHFTQIRKMAAVSVQSLAAVKPIVGVCQMTSVADKQENLTMGKALISRAKSRGAQMVFLPECFDYVGESRQQSIAQAESLEGEIITSYRQTAREQSGRLSLGGFHQKGPEDDSQRVQNTHVVINNFGEIVATYSKAHLFDVDIKGRVRLCETDFTIPGSAIAPLVTSPVGNIGLAICYDLRFPEMSVSLAQQGAQILTYPSAFTVPTGMAHWETLLRARAVENQCYVIAAAQTGKHNAKRSSYGHSLVVDPWGCVVAQCREGIDVCVAEIDLEYLHKVRQEMPVMSHRRHDLYGHIHTMSSNSIESQETYQFGQHTVKAGCVFYRTALSFALVNRKPVLPGHVLVCPLRPAERFSDLTDAELADVSKVTQKVSKVIEKQYGASSLTISMQDGPEAGQSVKHVHIHVLPRKEGDFENNDDIYDKLQKHDKNEQGEELNDSSKLRTDEDMYEEASRLRKSFS